LFLRARSFGPRTRTVFDGCFLVARDNAHHVSGPEFGPTNHGATSQENRLIVSGYRTKAEGLASTPYRQTHADDIGRAFTMWANQGTLELHGAVCRPTAGGNGPKQLGGGHGSAAVPTAVLFFYRWRRRRGITHGGYRVVTRAEACR